MRTLIVALLLLLRVLLRMLARAPAGGVDKPRRVTGTLLVRACSCVAILGISGALCFRVGNVVRARQTASCSLVDVGSSLLELKACRHSRFVTDSVQPLATLARRRRGVGWGRNLRVCTVRQWGRRTAVLARYWRARETLYMRVPPATIHADSTVPRL